LNRAHLRGIAKKALGWTVTAIAAGFFAERIIANASHMPRIAWGAAAVGVSIASVLLALLAIVLSGLIWQVLLKDQRVRRPLVDVEALFLVSQFGKYLPGNVGQFVGRVVLGRDIGIPVPVTLATMLTEVLWSIGTALGVSTLSLYLFLDHRTALLPPWLSTAGLCVCFVALLVVPWIGTTLIRHVFPGVVNKVFAGSELRPPGWGAALRVSALYVATYASMGLILSLQAQVFFGASPAPLLEVSGFFALAWLAGYLLPGAPAGIGVRESVMLLLFTPHYGESVALAIGITLRFATTLADALAFVLGWYWRFVSRRSERHRADISDEHD